MGINCIRTTGAALLLALFVLLGILPARAHTPQGHPGAAHHGDHAEGMTAQHERMEGFEEAARAVAEALIHSDAASVRDGADRIVQGLEGHEKDVPLRNRERIADFHRLHVALGKLAGELGRKADARDLPGAAAAYGRLLQGCVTCHTRFRD